MTDINKAIRDALNEINNGWDYVISDYCTSKEQEEQTELDKQKELDDVVAKIKALVVETLKDEPIPEREDWYADHEGRKTLYNNATARIKARTRNDLRGEIRSIFE
jgi:hypothetical protein